MIVLVRLPKELRRLYGAPLPVKVEGDTVRGVIAAVDAAHPGLGHRLIDAGDLRRHIIVFVGDRQSGLDEPVAAGAEVTVVNAVAGG